MTARDELLDHLGTAVTTVCRAWTVKRPDGVTYGFTDHDSDLSFDGVVFRASTGMTARALQQATGMSVDNSEAVGALSDAAIDEAEIIAGRFDGAEVRSWLVNWQKPVQRIEQFRGNFGEISRVGGAFKAELRGQTDRLNQPIGRIYQRNCGAILGDTRCGFDLATPGFTYDATIDGIVAGEFVFTGMVGIAERWFERGQLIVVSGQAAGLAGVIKTDQTKGAMRSIGLWFPLGVEIAVGDQVRLIAGCDRTKTACQSKFDNFLNFQGFPHIPGEDWLTSYPTKNRINDGGSLGR